MLVQFNTEKARKESRPENSIFNFRKQDPQNPMAIQSVFLRHPHNKNINVFGININIKALILLTHSGEQDTY